MARRSASAATSSASTGFCSTRARAFASSSRLRSTWRSASTTSTSRRSRARGSLAIGPSASSAFVFCSISSAALSRRAGRASIFSSPIRPGQVRPLLVDLGDVRLLEPQPLLRLLELREPEALEDVVVLGLRLAQLLLDLGAAAQPAGHLDVAQRLVGRLAAAQPPADDGEHEPDPRHDAADDDRDHADVDDLGEAQREADDRDRDADHDEHERPARQRAASGPRAGPRS